MADAPPRPSDLESILERRGISCRLFGDGRALVATDCGRLLALATSPDEPNAFWSSPLLFDDTVPITDIPGGMGGERLWIGPEIAYFWNGVPDWDNFSNYEKQRDIDPGNYEFVTLSNDAIELDARMTLTNYLDASAPALAVHRRIEMESPPAIDASIRSTGVRLTHEIAFGPNTGAGVVDAWQVLQVRAGSRLLAPLRVPEEPMAYGARGRWRVEPDRINWDFTGTESTKLGLSATASTGRAASIFDCPDGTVQLIVRDFEVRSDLIYADHPYGNPRLDQVFQAWDGFGFGELEVRSPSLDATANRSLSISNSIWVFSGQRSDIIELAVTLLALDPLR